MAYVLHYWETGSNPDTHLELKSIRLKSIQEAWPLSLTHNRPNGCTLVTVDRTDNESNIEKIIWQQ